MQITLLLCLLDTGLNYNKVTFRLTPDQRLGNQVHNCVTYEVNVNIANSFLLCAALNFNAKYLDKRLSEIGLRE